MIHSKLRRPAAVLLDAVARLAARPLPDALLAQPAVVFAPHQDDETLGCGALIALKRARGAAVTVVFMADGTGSHPRFLDAATLRERRRAEALAACAELGVEPGDVVFLDLPDQHLGDHRERATALVRDLLRDHAGRQLVVPFRRDVTPDHVATREVVLAALAGSDAHPWVLEYAVWFWHHWPCVPAGPPGLRGYPRWLAAQLGAWLARLSALDRYVDTAPVRGRKSAALARHATQTARPAGQPDWPVLADVADGLWLARCLADREHYHAWRPAPRGGDA